MASHYYQINLPSGRVIKIPLVVTALTLILLIGAILRFWQLDRWSLWTDELYTWKLVPELRILTEGIPDDQHPPLYYLLLHYLIQFSDDEIWLRLPSAISGFLTIPVMWQIGVLLNRLEWGLLSAALIAVSPLHVWYSREARMYGFASLFWAASILLYFSVLLRGRWWDIVGLAVATLGGILTAYPTLGLWGIELSAFPLAWYWCGRDLARLWRWLVAQGLIVAGLIWWWPFFQQQLGRSGIFNWTLFSFLDLSGTLADTVRLALSGGLLFLLFGISLPFLVGLFSDRLSALRKHEGLLVTGISFLFVVVILLGAIPRGLSIRRQFLVFWPLVIMLGAWALNRLQNPRFTRAVLTLSLILAFVSVSGPPLEDWQGAISMIDDSAQADDTILLSPVWIRMGFDYYYEGTHSYVGKSLPALTQPNTLHPGDRLWFVYLDHTLLQAQTEPVKKWLDHHAQALSIRRFSRDIVVIEYVIQVLDQA